MVPQKAHKDGAYSELSLTISLHHPSNQLWGKVDATSSRIVVNHYWDANGFRNGCIMLKYFQFGEFPRKGRTMMAFPYLLSKFGSSDCALGGEFRNSIIVGTRCSLA